MPLPTLHWKFVGADTGLYASVQGVIDAIYRLGQSATYVDGSARVPGTGSAWTWTREGSGASTVAAIGAPPSVAPYENTLDIRYIFAGNGAAAPTTILTPDTNAAPQLVGTLWMGMNRGSTTYTGPWTAAQPFGSGFSGYWHGAGSFSTRRSVFMYESEEGCVVVTTDATGVTQHFLFGALFDPLSASGVESTGRLYYMQTQGWGQSLDNGAPFSYLAYNDLIDGGYGNHNATANTGAHCGYFNPGLTTITTAYRFERFATLDPSLSLDTSRWRAPWLTANGDQVKTPFHAQKVTAPQTFLGPARNMWFLGSYPCGSVVQNGSTVLGYAVGPVTTYTYGSILLGV